MAQNKYDLTNFTNTYVAVVGDVMLDHWIYGTSRRISPEAPVPIVNYKTSVYMLGGAANVARNIAHMGGQCVLVGAVGHDPEADIFNKLLAKEPNIINCCVTIPGRQTTIKTRIVSNNHQLARVDKEQTDEIAEEFIKQATDKLFDTMRRKNFKAFIISDYGKGFVTHQLCQTLVESNYGFNTILVDPKGTNWAKYRGAYMITPNAHELATMVKQDDLSDVDIIQQSQKFMQIYDFGAVLTTRAEEGMILCTDSGENYNIPAHVRDVADVSGAGDTVIATMSMMMANGFNLQDCMEVANVSAGISVSKKGTATVSLDELQKAVDTI